MFDTHAAVEYLTNWVETHRDWAGILVFIISMIESLAVLGTLIPGTVIMTAVGITIGMGLLDTRLMFLYGIAGAICGDGISYAIGYRYRNSIHSIWPFKRFPKLLINGEKFFHKHGGKSVFLGRFVGPIRAMTPLIAGTMSFNLWRFLIADILSAILFIPCIMIPGIFLGAAAMELPHSVAIGLILGFLLTIISCIFILWLIRHFYRSVAAILSEKLNRLWQYLISKPRLHTLCFILKYHDEHERGQLSRALSITLLILALSLLTMDVHLWVSHHYLSSGITSLNQPISYFFQTIRSHSLDKIMVVMTFFGQKEVLLPSILALAAWLYYRGYKSAALHCLILAGLAGVGGEILKHMVNSRRPWDIIEVQASTPSFPSGHTTLATAIYGFISYLVAKRYHHLKRALFYTPFLLLTALVAISRLYLEAHWFTDVLGGFLLGLIAMQLTIFSYRRITIPHMAMRDIIITPLLILFLGVSVYGATHYEKTLANSQLKPLKTPAPLTLDNWWNNPGKNKIPLKLDSRLGHPIQTLNFQWAGDLATIETRLTKDDWTVMEHIQWADIFNPHELALKSNRLIVFSKIFERKKPAITLIKNFGADRIILNLWKTNYKVGQKPLWVGRADYRYPVEKWLKPKPPGDDQRLLSDVEINLRPLFDVKNSNGLILIKSKRK